MRGDELTPRETEVLALIAVGHSAPEISERLNRSVRTVESHRANGFRKLGVTSTAEVVAWALHNGQVLSDHEEWNSARFLLTVRQSPLMVLVADAEMRFSNASHAVLRELGYSCDELLELSVPEIVVDRTDAEERYENYLLTGTQHGTITLRRKDGTAVETSYTATIRHLGDEQHYVAVLVAE